jgi:MOSC domain-containing protein YiiM
VTLTEIFIKRAHGGRMDAQCDAVLEPGRGLVGNADRGGRRQVTLLSEARWTELTREVGASLGPEARRANLVISEIEFENTRGRILRVGACRLRIGGETRPCEQMEDAAAGLQKAMRERWGGGAYAEVLDGGPITVGDTVSWDSDTTPTPSATPVAQDFSPVTPGTRIALYPARCSQNVRASTAFRMSVSTGIH